MSIEIFNKTGDFLMKRHKYKAKKFSGVTLLRKDAELIRKLAQEREIPVYQMTEQIVKEWAGWREPSVLCDTENTLNQEIG
jgi:hypothetical protein